MMNSQLRKLRNRVVKFDHEVIVEDCDEVEFTRMMDWVKINIPTTDRRTPNFRPPTFDPDMPTKLVFRFRTENQAMAFKLVK